MGTILLGFEPGTLSEAQLAQIRAAAPDVRVLVTRDLAEIESVLDEVEIVAGRFPRDLLPRARNLRWFQQWGAGADWLLRHPEAVGLDFVLTNASGVHPIPITEHILAFLLAFARGLHRAVRAQERGEWIPKDQLEGLFELAGKTMLLVGVGAIGERTATVVRALGMRVWGVRRNVAAGVPGVEAMFGPDRLLELLPEADFVVLTVPLTHETQGMIGEQELHAMKPAAYLVNIGRGGSLARGWTSLSPSLCRRIHRCGTWTTSSSRPTTPGSRRTTTSARQRSLWTTCGATGPVSHCVT
jgi:phosphoglycerate dehydrogenase-like enzyme